MSILIVDSGSTPAYNTSRLLDVGAFFDRFGVAKIPILMCTDPKVQAIVADTRIRKWIDLDNPEVAGAVAYIASKVPELTPILCTAILNTPVTPMENLALRKTYF